MALAVQKFVLFRRSRVNATFFCQCKNLSRPTLMTSFSLHSREDSRELTRPITAEVTSCFPIGAQFSRKAFTLQTDFIVDFTQISLVTVFCEKLKGRPIYKSDQFIPEKKLPVAARNISKCITIRKQTNMAPARTITSSTTQWPSATSQYVQVNLTLLF